MKKILYTFLAAAAMFFAAGCEQESLRPASDGTVNATFTVNFAQPATKADISDGTTATQLVVGVYDRESGALVTSQSWLPDATDHLNAFTGLTAKFPARLVKGHQYDLVFFAQAPGNTAYTIDLSAKTLTVKPAGVSNDETRDAFYGTYAVDEVGDTSIEGTVVLKRPFAQINVIDLKADFEAAKDALVTFGKSSLKLTAPSVMNLLDGTVGTPVEYDLTAGAMSAEHPDFEPYKAQGDYWLMDNYILAGTAKSLVDLSFSLYETGSTAALSTVPVSNVPVLRNYRTNIYGSLLTQGGEFVVTIDPVYEGQEEFPIEGKVPEVTMVDTTLPAAGSSLTAEVDGTINFKATHPLATVPATYKSSNTAVGTITAEGLFTAVAPGTTVVTISFPAVENGVVKSSGDTYASWSQYLFHLLLYGI